MFPQLPTAARHHCSHSHRSRWFLRPNSSTSSRSYRKFDERPLRPRTKSTRPNCSRSVLLEDSNRICPLRLYAVASSYDHARDFPSPDFALPKGGACLGRAVASLHPNRRCPPPMQVANGRPEWVPPTVPRSAGPAVSGPDSVGLESAGPVAAAGPPVPKHPLPEFPARRRIGRPRANFDVGYAFPYLWHHDLIAGLEHDVLVSVLALHYFLVVER